MRCGVGWLKRQRTVGCRYRIIAEGAPEGLAVGVGITILAVYALGRSDVLSQRHGGEGCFEGGSIVAGSGLVRARLLNLSVTTAKEQKSGHVEARTRQGQEGKRGHLAEEKVCVRHGQLGLPSQGVPGRRTRWKVPTSAMVTTSACQLKGERCFTPKLQILSHSFSSCCASRHCPRQVPLSVSPHELAEHKTQVGSSKDA